MGILREIIEQACRQNGLPQRKTEVAFRTILKTIKGMAMGGERIQIHHFGTFYRRDLKQLQGSTLVTGRREPVYTPAGPRLGFRDSKAAYPYESPILFMQDFSPPTGGPPPPPPLSYPVSVTILIEYETAGTEPYSMEVFDVSGIQNDVIEKTGSGWRIYEPWSIPLPIIATSSELVGVYALTGLAAAYGVLSCSVELSD